MKSINLIFITILFTLSSYSQTSADTHSNIRKSNERKDHSTTINRLKALRQENSQVFTANNYDYLLARLYEKKGETSNAVANYQMVVKRNSVLKEYALWHLSQIMRNSGNLLMERLFLQEFLTLSEKSLLQNAVQKRLAGNYFESGNYEMTIKLLNGRLTIIDEQKEKTTDNEKLSRKDSVLLGNAYLQNKQTEKAIEIFTDLVENVPKPNRPDDFALAGVKGLDSLEVGEDNFGKIVPKLSVEEHLKRGMIYQFNRNFPLARLHFEAIAKNHPESEKAPLAMYQIGRGFGQERNYEKVVEWAERLQKTFPEDDLAKLGLYQAAGAFANLDKTKESVSRYVKYINENPDAKNLERAFLNIIDAYRDEGNFKTALPWASKTQERFKGEMGEAVALFSQARIHIAQEMWQNALQDLNALKEMKDLGGIRIAGGTNKAEIAFLRGYMLEKLGRFDEASDVYLSISDGRKEYYGWRASERLKTLADEGKVPSKINLIKKRFTPSLQDVSIPTGKILELGRKNVLQEPRNENSKPYHQKIADELLFLGLYDEGTPELETALREKLSQNTGSLSDFPTDVAFTLATFYKRGDMAHRAISYIEPIWKKIPRDYPIEMIPREQIELLYPKPYEDSLVKYGKEKQVDPRFLLSIMRQESRFQADVKSFAAARGLMQFISTTSEKMADEMKIENFRQDDLYNPPTAIRFGSHYIAKIFKDFPNQPPAVAASYNGGEDRMMRWFKRSKTENLDQYVPEVIFSQTKDYVYKVMTNYRIYKLLYDENLKNIRLKNEFEIPSK